MKEKSTETVRLFGFQPLAGEGYSEAAGFVPGTVAGGYKIASLAGGERVKKAGSKRVKKATNSFTRRRRTSG